MTADAFRPEFDTKAIDSVFTAGKQKLGSLITFIGYVGVFVGYLTIFLISLLTVGFLEIREANMTDFNALIAVLEQRDGYKGDHLKRALDGLNAEREAYRSRIDSLVCFDLAGATVVTENARVAELANSEASATNPKTCAEIKATLQRHANELALTEDEMRFRFANLPFWYDQYKDGITRKSPQIIPALRLLDSDSRLLTLWARSPFELIEMFLLVCMGLLGGVISVMRCFVDPKLKTPAIAEFFYKPAAGAAISLGVYVLFRAAQLFLGVQSDSGTGTVSTSIFLLAGLGLASGFCATDALAQIEAVAVRLLRRSGRDASGGAAGEPLGPTPNRSNAADTGPAPSAAATPG
jgi:hypothetical protein